MKRIGHKGAHLIEAGNTSASFDAARSHGVDMIEFDVIRWRGRLVIAHDPHDAAERAGGSLLTLEEGLEHLGGEDFRSVDLDVDMKHRYFELELTRALTARGLSERTTITTMHADSLELLRDRNHSLRLGLTIPYVSRDWLNVPTPVKALVAGGVVYHRMTQPPRVARLLRAGTIDLVMAFHAVVSRRLVEAVHGEGGELYSWTVDDSRTIARLVDLDVDGIVSNDPRLLAELPRRAAIAPA